jgi:two-component system response regulator NreC
VAAFGRLRHRRDARQRNVLRAGASRRYHTVTWIGPVIDTEDQQRRAQGLEHARNHQPESIASLQTFDSAAPAGAKRAAIGSRVASHVRPGRAVDVALVESRTVMRQGLRAIIERESDLVVVADAETVRDAKGLDVTPDVVVIGIQLPDAKYGDVITGLREVFRQSSILVFAPVGNPAQIQAVLAAGADGYLLETAEPTELLTGIRTVAYGEPYLQPALGVELALSQIPSEIARLLSPREQHILYLLVLGHTNVDVARLCNISLRTAETHRAHIQRKLDRHTRAELVEYAREAGLVRFRSP